MASGRKVLNSLHLTSDLCTLPIMCSELFRIPYVWDGVPIFGFGVLLAIWAIVGLVSFAASVRRHGWNGETGASCRCWR